jgi:hypothetical protein
VLEFFMQTLVKRKKMAQSVSLGLNQFLMVVSTSTALPVLQRVMPVPALVSILLNFINRGREMTNIAVVAVVAIFAARGFDVPTF